MIILNFPVVEWIIVRIRILFLVSGVMFGKGGGCPVLTSPYLSELLSLSYCFFRKVGCMQYVMMCNFLVNFYRWSSGWWWGRISWKREMMTMKDSFCWSTATSFFSNMYCMMRALFYQLWEEGIIYSEQKYQRGFNKWGSCCSFCCWCNSLLLLHHDSHLSFPIIM